MKVRALPSFVVLTTLCLVGCGHYTCGITFGSSTCTPSGGGISQTGGNSIPVTSFVYFVDDADSQIAVAGLNVASSETFAPVSNFVSPPLPTAPTIDFGGVIVNQEFLYIPFVNNTLYGFFIDGSTGALAPVLLSPYSVTSPASIAADPAGRFLFVGGGTGISVFLINASDGSLTPSGSTLATTSAPTQMVTDGNGQFLYALEGSQIAAYSYAAVSGALTAVAGSPFSFTPAMAQISGESSGKYIVGITAQDGANGGIADDSIYVFAISQSGSSLGALSPVAGSPFATLYSPLYMTVSPNGAFVYTFNQNAVGTTTQADPMEGYALDSSTGKLTALSTSPFTTLTSTIGKFDQSGQYMFAEGSVLGVGSMFAYAADPTTGALASTLPQVAAPSASFAVTDAP
jgi:6-phosphogluconolactonase (cycloisomerase 2 family)